MHPECPTGHAEGISLQVGDGPITSFGWLHHDGPPVAFARGPAPLGDGTSLIDATATDLDPEMAGTKAVAELLERQAAHLRPRAPVRLRPFARVGDVPGWDIRARSLPAGEAVWIPAERFVLASQTTRSGPGEGDSTGMAVGPTSRDAIISGLLEAVERAGVAAFDAYGPEWRIQSADLGGPFQTALTQQGWSLDIVGGSCAGFAVAVCVASRDGHSIAGAGAHPGAVGAATRAVAEAYMKSVGLHGDNAYATVSTAARLATEQLWPDLPQPDSGGARAEPLDYLRRFTTPAAVVDRGNALLDAIGWRAAHVILLLEPPPVGAPRLARLL